MARKRWTVRSASDRGVEEFVRRYGHPRQEARDRRHPRHQIRAGEAMSTRSLFSAAALLIGLTALAAPTHAADKLRVGKSVGTAWTFMPLDVGLHEGIFTKYGVDLEVANF